MGDGTILDSLTLKLFVLVLKIPDDVFQFLDTLRFHLLLLLLSLILGRKLCVKPSLELLDLRSKVFLKLTQLLQLSFHLLLFSLPFLFLKCRCLLSILRLILELENLFTEVLYLL